MDQQVLHGHKGGAGKQHTPVEEKNTLLSKSYAKVLLAIGEGEFAGNPTAEDIYLDGTPLQSAGGLQNFGGVKWEYRSGRSDQSYITGVPDVSNEFAINLALTNDTPWTRLITTPSLDAVRITLAWPAVYEQKDNGDIVGYNIEYAIDVSTNGGAYVEQGKWSTNNQKTTVEYNRTHRIDLPKPGTSWTLRVRRLTPNKNNGKFGDTMSIKSIAEVIDAKLRYPNTALLFVEFDAETFGGSSIPKISVKTKGRLIQVPANYDPEARTYSGVWNGTFKWAYTNNPAWVFYDLVTNERFGLGSRITADMVDKWTLYQVSQYCDVLVPDGNGGTEPRYTCNIYIQSRKEAWQVLRDVVGIFNGMLHWSGTQIVASADMPVATNTVRTYSRSNVVDGKFTYGSTSEKTITTTALVSYDDPDNHYETAVEAVNDLNLVQRYKTWNQSEIAAIGVTSRGQAQRKGKYQMLTNSINRMVTFKLGLDGYLPRPGEVVGVADQVLAGSSFSGRISAATLKTVTCDRVPNVAAGDILYVNSPDGSTGEGRTVQSVNDKTITVTANYSAIPTVELGWYVEKTNLKSQLYRITKVTWAENDAKFEVTGVQYEDSKYAAIDSGARLESRPITSIPAGGQDAPTGLALSSFTFVEQTMAVTTLSVKWNPAVGAMNYEAQWRKDGGDWVNVGLTASTGFDIKGIYSGAYQARVRAINAIGTKSLWTESANTELNGKDGLPPTVATFTTAPEIFGIRLSWTFPEGAEDTAYIQLQQAANIAGDNATELSLVAYPATSYVKSNMLGGVVAFFRGRLIDRSGNEGPWSAWTYGISEYGTDKILESIEGEIGRTELGQELLTELDQTQIDLTQTKQEIALIDTQVAELKEQLDTDIAAVNTELDGINADITQLQHDIATAVSSGEYDATKTYATGDIVRKGTRLYQALSAVPVNQTPPNATYWKDVGTTLTEAGATAAQVALNTTSITNQGNTLTTHTSQLSGLTTRITDAETNITSNSSALSNLSSTVSQQGDAITSQGQAITNVTATVDNLGAAGTNLLEDTYSWLTSTTLPTTVKTAALTTTGIAVAEADSKFGYQVGNLTASNQFVMLSPTNNAAGYNVRIEPGTYLVSFYIKGSAAGQVMVSLHDGTQRLSGNASFTTVRTRVVLPVTVTDSARVAVTIYPNRTNVAALEVVIDSVMIERRIGTNNIASPFVSGSSAAATANNASATTALTARVTTAEGTITSQGNSITTLNNSLANKADATALTALTNRVTTAEGNITSNSGSITTLNNQVNSIGGDNLLANSSFEEAVSGGGRAKYWSIGSTASGTTTTLVDSSLPQSIKAQRVENPAVPFNGYIDVVYVNDGISRPKVTPGSSYVLTAWVRGTPGQTLRQYMRFYDAAGTAILTPTTNFTLTDTYQRYTFVYIAPANSATATVYAARIINGSAGTTALWMEVDNAQFQEGLVATAYLPSGEQNATAQAAATSALTTRVSAAEGTLTSQGSAVTSLQNSLNSISGTGSNLLVDEYSWITSTTLPLTVNNGTTRTGVAVAESFSGYGYSVSFTTTNTSAYLGFTATSITNGNMMIEPGTYLVSMYMKGDANNQALVNLYGPGSVSRLSANVAYTTARTRVAFTVTVADSGKMALLVYPNRNGLASGTVVIDSVMVEKQVGNGTTPSPFVAGPSAAAVSAQSAAMSALTSRVTAAEGTITSQGSSITQISSIIGQQPDNLILKGTFEDGTIGPWTASPTIANVSAHPSYSKAIQFMANSFCGIAYNVICNGGEVFDCSADIWNNYMSSGQTARLQMQFFDKSSVSLGYYTAFTCYAGTTGFQTYSGRVTAPTGAVSARYVIRHETSDGTGRSLWCNIVSRRVTAAETATADATSALSATVTSQGNTITSQGGAITNIQASIENIGGDNLLANSSFDVEGTAAGLAQGWVTAATVAGTSNSLVSSTLSQSTKAQRVDHTGLPANGYMELRLPNTAADRIKVNGGKPYVLTTWARGSTTAGFAFRQYVAFYDAAGAGVGTPTAVHTPSDQYTRYTMTMTAPATAVSALVYVARLMNGGATTVAAWMEVDNVQFQEGLIATAYSPSTEQSANVAAAATAALTATVNDVDGKVDAISKDVRSITAQARQSTADGDLADALQSWTALAAVQTERIARADADGAFAQDMNVVSASVSDAAGKAAEAMATIQTVSTAQADTDGKLSAMYSVKLGVNANGQYYGAGMGIGIENTPSGMQSQVLFVADRFAILNSINGTTSSPFVVQGGQTIINNALIGDATIGFAKIGDDIQSTNYVAGQTGWKLSKAGSLEINGTVAGGGRLTINNNLLAVYDASGVLRVRLGMW